jgi:simple sugar transport system permease protein
MNKTKFRLINFDFRQNLFKIGTSLLGPALAILIALIFVAPLISFSGSNPLEAYSLILKGAFGSVNALAETLVKTSPLWLVGVGIAVAFRGGMFNVGAEGQLFLGAVASTFVGIKLQTVPWPIALPLTILAGFLAGALWAALAGFLKVRFGVSEIIVTIMQNYIALLFVSEMVHGPLQDKASSLPQTALIGKGATLPILLPGTRLHLGVIFAFLALLIIYLLLWKTTRGYKVRVAGANPEAARIAGINMYLTPIMAMALSGGLAGLAGTFEVAGLYHILMDSFPTGYGFTAITVALLGGLNPAGVAIAAFALAGLSVGGNNMQRILGVPAPIVDLMQGIILLFAVLGPLLQYWRSRKSKTNVEKVS